MHIVGIEPQDEGLGAALLVLQRAAYAVEAQLIGDDRIPALHETFADLRAAPLIWLAALDQRCLVGAVAWSRTSDLTDIDRLVVDPRWHRQGVGRALVEEVLNRCDTPRVVVCTGRGNLPARSLYEGIGFTAMEDVEVIPRLWVTRYTLHR